MNYERITITRFSISGGFIIAVVTAVVIAANYKAVGPAVNTAITVLTDIALAAVSAVGLCAVTGLTIAAIRGVRWIKRQRNIAPSLIHLYPEYVARQAQEIPVNDARVLLNGKEYVYDITDARPSKTYINSRYGKDQNNA